VSGDGSDGRRSTVASVSPKLLELDKGDVNAVRSFRQKRIPRQDGAAVAPRSGACPSLPRTVQVRKDNCAIALSQLSARDLTSKHAAVPALRFGFARRKDRSGHGASERKPAGNRTRSRSRLKAVQEGSFRIGPYLDTLKIARSSDRRTASTKNSPSKDQARRRDSHHLTGDSAREKFVLN